MNENIRQLNNLKSKLKNHKMSALIGAGFSKNVSHEKFVNWPQLLEDLVLELYGPEIEESYERKIYNHKNKIDNEQFKSTFYKSKTEQIIERIGYLEIVSNYIRRKGFKESIASYIEERIPYVFTEEVGSEKYLVYKGEKEKLTGDHLILHKKLIQLPWNNIYTTNYDQLLDVITDSKLEDKINDYINTIKEELSGHYRDLESHDKEIETLDEQIRELESKMVSKSEIASEETSLNTVSSKSSNIPNEQTISGLSNQKNKKKNRRNNLLQIIRDKEETSRNLTKKRDDNFTVVKKSSQLSVKRNRNIIKLHGSLRTESCKFGFDDDINKHYVIAKEDYDSYPQKHEAFTQLMRISLLQESFCLIGFSGVDPNFISWIGWVRDVLMKKQEGDEDEYKVFLIDTESGDLSNAKQLFYENHKIYRIPITNPEVVSFLQNEGGYKSNSKLGIREILKLFFKYLGEEYNLNEAQVALENKKQSDYQKLWDKINSLRPPDFDFQSTFPLIDNLYTLKPANRIPHLRISQSLQKKAFLFHSLELIEMVEESFPEERVNFIKLVFLAVQDHFIPIDRLWTKSEQTNLYRKLHGVRELQIRFNLLKLKTFTLRFDLEHFSKKKKNLESQINLNKGGEINNVDVENSLIYETILLTAFSLNFDKLIQDLESWKPTNSHWILKKAGLLLLFDNHEEEVKSSLIKILEEDNEYTNHQEKLYLYELLSYAKKNSWEIDKGLGSIIERYKGLGFKGISENLNTIFDEVLKNDPAIKPFGEGRFNIDTSISFTNVDPIEQHIQILQLIIEAGFPLALSSVHYFSFDKWYVVQKHFFEMYPLPALFYTLQYKNEKILRRISQEYANSDILKNQLNEISSLALNSYLLNHTPAHYKRNILAFTSELFIAVSPEVWQDKFYKIWSKLYEEGKAFSGRMFYEFPFIIKALPYIKNYEILTNILTKTIEYENIKKSLNASLGYSFYLSQNINLSKVDFIKSKEFNDKINLIIKNIPQAVEDTILLLGNLYELINETHNRTIIEQ